MPRKTLVSHMTWIAAGALVLVGCAGAPDESGTATAAGGDGTGSYPVDIENCGRTLTFESAPAAAITMNQGATEIALALGLEDHLAGTAYLDDEISPRWSEAYEAVPVLSDEYPSREEFLASGPDFAYSSYSSAFDKKTVGSRDELESSGINTYISPLACPEDTQVEPSFDDIWIEITDIGTIFGVPDRAEALVDEQRGQITELTEQNAGEGLSILWYDSGDKTPFVGGGGGGPQQVIEAVGATNMFADLPGGWADASWESVMAGDPDVIVLADASWSTADEKRRQLENDPVTSQLRAVQEGNYVVMPFSETTPGVRLADGARKLAAGLAVVQEN